MTSVSNSRRLVYICDWLPPDFGAVGQYSVLFSRELAANGHDVILAGLSTSGNSDTAETIGLGRYREIKLAATSYTKSSSMRRLFWTAKTNTRLLSHLWRHLRAADTILFTGSPPLFLHWIAPANLILRKKLVYRITDFHPECAIAQVGHAGPLLKFLYRITLFWRRRVDRFEVLGEDQVRRLREIGIAEERICLKRDPSPVVISRETPALERPPGTESSLLLLYSGNWGIAHDYRTFVEGYRLHHSQGSARFVLWLNAWARQSTRLRTPYRQTGYHILKGRPCRGKNWRRSSSRRTRTLLRYRIPLSDSFCHQKYMDALSRAGRCFLSAVKSPMCTSCAARASAWHMSGVTLETLEPARGRSTSLRE